MSTDELTPAEVKAIVAEIDAWRVRFVAQPLLWRIASIGHLFAMPNECYLVTYVNGLAGVFVRNEDGQLVPASKLTYFAPDFDRAKQREEAHDSSGK